jgi:hypothetical protein
MHITRVCASDEFGTTPEECVQSLGWIPLVERRKQLHVTLRRL